MAIARYKFFGRSVLTAILIFAGLLFLSSCRPPFYYKLHQVEGTIYEASGNPVHVAFHSKRKLIVTNCQDPQLDTFLHTLAIGKHGRQGLEHLLTTSAKMTVIISEKIGLYLRDGKYRLMAGLTGPDSVEFIVNEVDRKRGNKKPNSVYKDNTIEIFKGSIAYANDTSKGLTEENIRLFDLDNNEGITHFSLDTIKIEPIRFPEYLYQNWRELFYFAGVHEIYHTRPENIHVQRTRGDTEIDAWILEIKAFKKRKAINKRKIKTKQ